MTSDWIGPAPGVQWVIEADGLLVFRRGSNTPLRLRGAEAAFWGILSRGHDHESTLEMVASIAGWDRETTQTWVRVVLVRWQEKGYLAPKRGTDG